MHARGYSLAIVLSTVGMFAAPKAARAQRAVSQWDWKPSDYSCNIEHLSFSSDATVWLTFREEGFTDMDDGTWALDGANLDIKYSNRFPDEMTGTYAKESLCLVHSWKSRDGSAHGETCTFTIEPAKGQPTQHRRLRHKAG